MCILSAEKCLVFAGAKGFQPMDVIVLTKVWSIGCNRTPTESVVEKDGPCSSLIQWASRMAPAKDSQTAVQLEIR
jgi:hypothetical protein